MTVFIEKLIFRAYISVLEISQSPTISAIIHRFNDIVEREALTSIYPEIKFEITETDVSETMVRYKCSHTYFGEPAFDAQAVLFEGWLEHIKLLRSANDGQDGNNRKT